MCLSCALDYVSVCLLEIGMRNTRLNNSCKNAMKKSNVSFKVIWIVCVMIYAASWTIAQEKSFTKEKKSGYETISNTDLLIDSLFTDARAVAIIAIRELQRCKMRESLYVEKATLDSMLISELSQDDPIVSLRTLAIAGVSITIYSLIQLIFGGR